MSRFARIIERHSAAVLVLCFLVAFGLARPATFLSQANLENIARQISLDAPMVFGQVVVLIAGGIDISVGANMAMAAALTIGLQQFGTPAAVLGALTFGLVAGLANGLMVTRGKIVAFVATLGTMSVMNGLVLTYTGQQSLSGHDLGFTWWGGGQIGPIPVPLVVVLTLLIGLYVLLEYTRYGRDLYAIGGNREAAFLGGVSVNSGLLLAFAISGLMSAVAGVLVASRLNSASAQLGGDASLMSISAALIGGASLLGGKGRIAAAFLGVLALGMLNNGMNLLGVPTYTQIAVRALILIAIVAIDAFGTKLARRGGASPRFVD
ncbi:MAG TPA: ABC transporter permease [Roseiarcus sp.]|jgi:ribose/xylose/arabinose/galactoside ABC-type transport system permease subunit